MIDITARKQAEAELVAARRAAEAASKAKSQFLATMSHEIRTPLSGVLGIAEMMVEGASPEQRRLLAIIRESGETLLEVINDILDISKIEAGQLTLEHIAFAPADIARRTEALFRPGAEARGLTLSVSTTGKAQSGRIGDPHRIQQILHNLVGNALKFTAEGWVSVVFGGDEDGSLTIEVRDTGIGISQEHQARLFDKFAQADSSTTRRFGGTGLGMSIVASLVDWMGGRLSVESALGQGTVVRIALPLPSTTIARAPSEPMPSLTPPVGLRILVAEDNGVNRIIHCALLERIGAVVTMTEDGPSAVAACKAGTFDLLMLDICMPVMDGIDTLDAIRTHEAAFGLPSAPAIAITANTLRDQIAEYLAAGFAAHVSKPLEQARLNTTVIACLAPP